MAWAVSMPDNALQAGEELKALNCFLILDRHIFGAAAVLIVRVLGPDARIVQASGNGMGDLHLPVAILQSRLLLPCKTPILPFVNVAA